MLATCKLSTKTSGYPPPLFLAIRLSFFHAIMAIIECEMKIYLENAKCRSKKTFFFLFKNRGKGIWPSQKPFCLPPPRQKILETSLWCTQDPATGTQYHIAPNRKLWHQPYIASLISFAANANI